MDNLIEELNKMTSEDQEMLSLLPKNNKNDVDEYLKRIINVRIKYKKIKKEITDELKKYNDLFLLDESNSTYEKMGLDKLLYNLKYFYKSDLNLINTDILECISAFQNCNINLTAEDFQYNEFTYRYMTIFFEEIKNNSVNSYKIKDIFEEIYWKCTDIIKHIKLNIEYL